MKNEMLLEKATKIPDDGNCPLFIKDTYITSFVMCPVCEMIIGTTDMYGCYIPHPNARGMQALTKKGGG